MKLNANNNLTDSSLPLDFTSNSNTLIHLQSQTPTNIAKQEHPDIDLIGQTCNQSQNQQNGNISQQNAAILIRQRRPLSGVTYHQKLSNNIKSVAGAIVKGNHQIRNKINSDLNLLSEQTKSHDIMINYTPISNQNNQVEYTDKQIQQSNVARQQLKHHNQHCRNSQMRKSNYSKTNQNSFLSDDTINEEVNRIVLERNCTMNQDTQSNLTNYASHLPQEQLISDQAASNSNRFIRARTSKPQNNYRPHSQNKNYANSNNFMTQNSFKSNQQSQANLNKSSQNQNNSNQQQRQLSIQNISQPSQQQFGFQKMITICGYLETLQLIVNRTLKRNDIKLKDQEKRDFTKVLVQVPKRRAQIKNFTEDDPRLEKIQSVLIDKLKKKTDPSIKNNFISQNAQNGRIQGNSKNLLEIANEKLLKMQNRYQQVKEIGERQITVRQKPSGDQSSKNSENGKYQDLKRNLKGKQVFTNNIWSYTEEMTLTTSKFTEKNLNLKQELALKKELEYSNCLQTKVSTQPSSQDQDFNIIDSFVEDDQINDISTSYHTNQDYQSKSNQVFYHVPRVMNSRVVSAKQSSYFLSKPQIQGSRVIGPQVEGQVIHTFKRRQSSLFQKQNIPQQHLSQNCEQNNNYNRQINKQDTPAGRGVQKPNTAQSREFNGLIGRQIHQQSNQIRHSNSMNNQSKTQQNFNSQNQYASLNMSNTHAQVQQRYMTKRQFQLQSQQQSKQILSNLSSQVQMQPHDSYQSNSGQVSTRNNANYSHKYKFPASNAMTFDKNSVSHSQEPSNNSYKQNFNPTEYFMQQNCSTTQSRESTQKPVITKAQFQNLNQIPSAEELYNFKMSQQNQKQLQKASIQIHSHNQSFCKSIERAQQIITKTLTSPQNANKSVAQQQTLIQKSLVKMFNNS